MYIKHFPRPESELIFSKSTVMVFGSFATKSQQKCIFVYHPILLQTKRILFIYIKVHKIYKHKKIACLKYGNTYVCTKFDKNQIIILTFKVEINKNLLKNRLRIFEIFQLINYPSYFNTYFYSRIHKGIKICSKNNDLIYIKTLVPISIKFW